MNYSQQFEKHFQVYGWTDEYDCSVFVWLIVILKWYYISIDYRASKMWKITWEFSFCMLNVGVVGTHFQMYLPAYTNKLSWTSQQVEAPIRIPLITVWQMPMLLAFTYKVLLCERDIMFESYSLKADSI